MARCQAFSYLHAGQTTYEREDVAGMSQVMVGTKDTMHDLPCDSSQRLGRRS